jgi:hypothetical protein
MGVSNVIEYVTMSSEGNATDFGDLAAARDNFGSCGNTTRGVFSGGFYVGLGTSGNVASNVIDYITIASTGNVTDFGDLTVGRQSVGSGVASSSTRGLTFGGDASSTSDVIDYITIASTGNATDFGDLTSARSLVFSTSNATKAVCGRDSWIYDNNIDVVTIASTGNATDFGDLVTGLRGQSGACGGQGGLTG